MAIVSKAVFEKMVPKGVAVGHRVETDRYTSTNKIFATLADGGALFLVTVRPPDERLWLVAIVEEPKLVKDAWVGAMNTTPITDVTAVLPKLTLESGQGIKAKKGALGMSLQTPRVLTAQDDALLRGTKKALVRGTKKAEQPAKPAAKAPVVWTKLKHARGSAKGVPELLEKLYDVAWRERAVRDFDDAFVRSGEAFQASGAMIATLVDLAAHPDTERPEELVALALKLLALGDVATLQATGLDRSDPKVRRRYSKPLATELVRAAHDSVPALLALLEDPRPALRGMAATMLGLLPDAAESSAPQLVASMSSEKDAGARALVILSSMYLARASKTAAPAVRAALEKLRDDAKVEPLARGAALVALACIDGKWPAVATSRDALVAFFTAAAPLTVVSPLVGDHTPGTLALRLLDRGPAEEDTHLEGALAALEGLRAAQPLPPDAEVMWRWPTPICERWFPARRGGHYAHINDPVDIAKLDEDSRRVLVALCEIRPTGPSYKHAGLPPDVRSRRRALGLDPPSLMDDVIKKSKLVDGPAPRWRVVKAAMDAYDKLKEETRPSLHEYAKANVFSLESKQWLEVWAEVHAEAHGLFTFVSPDPLVSAFADASAAELREFATRYLDEIVGHSTPKRPFPLGPDREMRANLGRRAVLALVRAKAPIPERHDHAMTLFARPDQLREIFEAIPRERRAGVVASIWEFTRSGRNKGNFDKSKVAQLLDLMPDAALYVMRCFRDLEHFEEVTDVNTIVRALAKKEPAVDAALQEALAAWKAPRPKPAPPKKLPRTATPAKAETKKVATYRFVEGAYFDLKAAEALKGAARKQFVYAAERYGAPSPKTPRDYFVWMGKEMDSAPEDTDGAKLWKIERTAEKGKTVYEMWTFLVDNGTVFEANTANHTNVEMIQGGFQSLDDEPESNELADELQEVVPF